RKLVRTMAGANPSWGAPHFIRKFAREGDGKDPPPQLQEQTVIGSSASRDEQRSITSINLMKAMLQSEQVLMCSHSGRSRIPGRWASSNNRCDSMCIISLRSLHSLIFCDSSMNRLGKPRYSYKYWFAHRVRLLATICSETGPPAIRADHRKLEISFRQHSIGRGGRVWSTSFP